MAISESLLLSNLRGHVGKQMVFKQRLGKTVLSKFPDMSNRVLSPKQIENNLRMEKADDYAKGIMGDKKLNMAAQVRLDVTSNKLYTALIREFYKKEKENTGNKKGS